MAASTTNASHLEAPAARGLGEPDTVLLVGGTRFPVHSAVVSRGSGVLRQLLSDFSGGGGGGGGGGVYMPTAPGGLPEICLFPSADAASSSSLASAASLNEDRLALVSHAGHFAAYLARLYSPTGTAPLVAGFDISAARGLLNLADFYDSPQLLPEIDNSLAASIPTSTHNSGVRHLRKACCWHACLAPWATRQAHRLPPMQVPPFTLHSDPPRSPSFAQHVPFGTTWSWPTSSSCGAPWRKC